MFFFSNTNKADYLPSSIFKITRSKSLNESRMTTDVTGSVDPFWGEGFGDEGSEKSTDDETRIRLGQLADIDIVGHIAICLFFAIVCYFENSIVIYIYTRGKKLLATEVFYIALAIIDMLACSVLLLFPFVPYYDEWQRFIFFASLTFVLTTNVSILSLMSLDRLKAVTMPLQYKSTSKQTIKITITTTAFLLTMGIITQILANFNSIFSMRSYVIAVFLIAFGTLIYSYSRIIYSLYARRAKATVSAVEMTTGQANPRYLF